MQVDLKRGRSANGEKISLPRSRTMADIAKLAGVSKITVSRALRDSPLVREETKQRIRTIARKSGYKFNKTARDLRLKKFHTIAVVAEQEFIFLLMEILGGIAHELISRKYDLLLCAPTEFSGDWGSSITSKAVDGIILLGQGGHDSTVKIVQQAGLPFVVWGAPPEDASYIAVGSDNRQGGRLAARRLIEVGRRRLVFLGDTAHAEERSRWAGFHDAVAGSRARIAARSETPFTREAGHAAVTDLLREGINFDGILACSDRLAMGAIQALNEAGLSVPDDVSVIGYDDIPMAAEFHPPLTTIRQEWQQAGRLLARKILQIVDGDAADSLMLPARIIIRKSCTSGDL